MAGKICDRRPCLGLARLAPLLKFEMQGESNEDLRAVVLATNASASESQHVTLRYCPFCGMRLDADIVELIQRARGPE